MNPEIHTYLQSDSHDFDEGFALFCRYSRNESLMSWIGRKKDMARLLYELKKLDRMNATRTNPFEKSHVVVYNRKPATAVAPVQQTGDSRPQVSFKTYDERRTRRADLPENLQAVYDAIADDYKIRRSHHEKMKAARTDKNRAEFRALLLADEDRISSGWEKIDKYLQSQETSKIEDSFKESTCRSYISKMLRKKELSSDQVEKIRIRVDALKKHGCTLSDEAVKKLQSVGIIY